MVLLQSIGGLQRETSNGVRWIGVDAGMYIYAVLGALAMHS